MGTPPFAQAFERSPVGMAFLTQEGRVLSANPALAVLVGKPRDEVEGTSLEGLLLPDEVVPWRGFFHRFRQGGGTAESFESGYLTSDGNRAWWSLSLSAQPPAKPGEAAWFVVAQDVTARRAAEDASRAKSEFLANMSHEIRTPLFTITGMTDLLRRDDLTRDQSHHAGQVASAAQHLLDLVNDVLDFSKIEAGQMSLESIPLDLDDVVGRSLEVVSLSAYRKGIELVLDVDPSVPRRWMGDPSRLRQVLVNLLSNAVKFTHQGRVTLTVEPGPTFRVRDTGVGISDDARSSLFQIFTQADNSTTRQYGGTGLGLAISQKLVGLMGGRIDFISVPQQGTEFSFTPALPPENASASAPGPRGTGQGVLVVDDDPGVREVLVRRLAEAGFAVVAVASRAEAHAALAAHKPDVVLIDQELGPEDGWQLASEVRASPATADVPLVLMSLLRKTLEPSPRYPADLFRSFVDKPVNTRTLGDLLAGGLEGRWTDAHAGPSDLTPAVPSSERLKILVAEDHEVNRDLFRLLLRSLGHDPLLVENGREACEVAPGAHPHLIFMDLQMPQMNGYEAARALRKLGVACPIVAVTASAVKGELERCQAAGMDGVLTKPFNLETLDAVVRSYTADEEVAVIPLAVEVTEDTGDEAFAYDEALAVFLGNRELLFQLIQKFLRQSLVALDNLDRAWEAHDTATLRAEAHALRGSSANLTARPLAQAAEALEQAAADQKNDSIPGLIVVLRQRLEAFEAAVRSL